MNAFISLDVAAGDPNTLITVNGSAFLPNESTSLYWDQPAKVSGASNADANGNFTTKVKPYPGDPPGVHRLCASVPPSPCASFTLQAAAASPTPTVSPSASPDTSPSPTASPTDSPSPTPGAAKLNTFDLMTRPPFVILPIIAGLGIVIALAYWILSMVMRPRQQPLKSVAVAHLATRPDYTAGFGAAPPLPAAPAPQPSAWEDVHPPTASPAPTPAAESAPLATAPEAPPPVAAHEVPPPAPVDETPRSDFGEATPAAPDEPRTSPSQGTIRQRGRFAYRLAR
ncbi:MAG TPA: hypothetical protein VGS16_13260 [Candidatus Dormibacteraeota bacterium]|nr:hypothetical protein [Candidatus Dormibacteraeota bacterium]